MRVPTILTLLCAASAALAAAGQETPFEGEQQVTAVDVVMELEGGTPDWLPGRQTPRADGLAALVDGVAAPVVAVQPPVRRFDRLVIYFDLPLCDDYQLTWGALLLADRAKALVDLGPVEVVVAAPLPRTVVPPTRDAAALEEALARLALFGDPQDRLVELRLEHGVSAPSADEPVPTEPSETAAPATETERQLVRSRLDALVLALADRTDGPDPRRAAILVSGGFDLETDPAFAPATEEAGRVLAAYGWGLVPLLAPEQAGPIPGLRLGKWRVTRFGIEGAIIPGIPLITATHEEDRDPKRAEAHLELAETLRDQGELERAADEAQAALKHFAGDPKTADRQAAALVLLSEVHQELGDPQRARRELRRAGRFDPQAVAGSPVMEAVPTGAARALTTLAAAGGGAPAETEDALEDTLARLGRRTLITVQMPGSADDALHEVEILEAGSGDVLGTGWLRYGTPQAVAEARARTGP